LHQQSGACPRAKPFFPKIFLRFDSRHGKTGKIRSDARRDMIGWHDPPAAPYNFAPMFCSPDKACVCPSREMGGG
jgi:hypothetical protein